MARYGRRGSFCHRPPGRGVPARVHPGRRGLRRSRRGRGAGRRRRRRPGRPGGPDARARARFRTAAVTALGEPARSAFEAGQARALLARTGWQVTDADADRDTDADGGTDASGDRLRYAGLLTATAAPDNWRAAVRPPVTLPHYPMVLHRGGYPDGS